LRFARHHGAVAESGGEPDIDWSVEAAIMMALMRIQATLDALSETWEDDDGEEEEGSDS
jgi:hypothetical protein